MAVAMADSSAVHLVEYLVETMVAPLVALMAHPLVDLMAAQKAG